MIYKSTRNDNITATPSKAVLEGIASDGGLFMFKPDEDIKLDLSSLIGKSFNEIAIKVLLRMFPDFSQSEMTDMVARAYKNKFETEDVTPTVKVGNKYVLELFRGPTSAFKDVALSMLPVLMTESIKKNGIKDKIVILTATSGDTGKAALEGFKDVDGTGIIVFFPQNGVSKIQKLQMTTQEGKNVSVCGISGNFDDAQTGVKNIFGKVESENLLKGKGVRLSSANSINIGRLAPQVVYYFKSYSDLVTSGEIKLGDKINFTVPTGNFGDILAGYIAKKMGLPVNKLICASNKNNVLTDFFTSGTYDKNREFFKTISPSMDILVSSNLERMLYLASNGNAELIASYMKELSENGKYTVSKEIADTLKNEFAAGYCDDKETKETIGKIFKEYGYLADTHTAVAFKVALDYEKENGNEIKNVILSTASPYKFSEAVAEGIGESAENDVFDTMRKLSNISNTDIPSNLSKVEKASITQNNVIKTEDMLDFVLNKV